MKTSRAYTGMLILENYAFKFSKTAKNIKSMCINAAVPACGTVLFLQTSPSFSRNMNVKVAVKLYVLYIFQNIKIWILVTFH